jgi:hypothetical protein
VHPFRHLHNRIDLFREHRPLFADYEEPLKTHEPHDLVSLARTTVMGCLRLRRSRFRDVYGELVLSEGVYAAPTAPFVKFTLETSFQEFARTVPMSSQPK